MTEYLKSLLEKYGLPIELLEVEITESAFVEETGKIEDELKNLEEAGFTVLMDDFGSGYSSLNTLKDLAIDILKIDMKFLRMDITNINKGVSILESIVNMARSLHLPTIIEGVETDEQVKFLTEMGCVYAQGFHFYRPMPVDEFERLLSEEEKVDYNGIFVSNLEPVHVREFLDENLFSDVVVNNILGPVAFYEVEADGTIRLIRMNDQYSKLIGREFVPEDEKEVHLMADRIRPRNHKEFGDLFVAAYESPLTGIEDELDYERLDGEEAHLRIRLFFLRERPDVRIYYANVERI